MIEVIYRVDNKDFSTEEAAKKYLKEEELKKTKVEEFYKNKQLMYKEVEEAYKNYLELKYKYLEKYDKSNNSYKSFLELLLDEL